MAHERLAYDDQDTALKMHRDCAACAAEMGLLGHISPELVEQVPPLDYDAYPRESRKHEITVTDATALLATQLHLHLD